MRRTQLLGIFLMVLVLMGTAVAAGPQLTAVSIDTQDNTTIIIIRASGPFTHTEYRPSDNLLLVDLPGISAGVLDGQSQSLQSPGVGSYRVQSFKGTGGTDVARIELNLVGTPFVTFNQDKGSLEVRVTTMGAAPAVAPAAAAPAAVTPVAESPAAVTPAVVTPVAVAPVAVTPVAVSPVATAPASQSISVKQSLPAPPAPVSQAEEVAPRQTARLGQPVWVKSVNVVHGAQGIEVDIRSNGPLKPSVMKIENPERIVLDLENARTARSVQVPVRSDDVKAVRMANFQSDPPVTRVVVDLEASRDYEVIPTDTGLRLKLHSPALVSSIGAPPVAPTTPQVNPLPQAATPATPATTQTQDSAPWSKPATNVVVAPKAEPVRQVATATPPANPAAAVAPTTVATQPKPSAAQDFVVVQPNYKPKAESDDPAARAADAASKFSGGKTEVALSNAPAIASNNAALHASVPVSAAVPQQPTPPQQMSMTGRPKYTGEPISVNLKDVDLKDFFRLIHEISGLNVVLDPNVHGSLTLVLDDVPWDQALDIVLKNNGLERELDGNVLRIATVDTLRREADSRRAQVEAQALAAPVITVTRFLSYAHSKDVVPTIKKFLSQRGQVMSDDRTNALIIQDIPHVFPEIDRLLGQLDRKTPEVEIEARVVAATRNFARDLGTQLGFAWGNGKSTAVGGASAVGTSPIVVTPPAGSPPPPYIISSGGSSGGGSGGGGGSGSGGGGIQIPLFTNMPAIGPTTGLSLINMGSNYRLDVVLTAAESRGLLKILSRPRVVTQNNIQAVVRQGVRIPVVTQAQLGGPPTTTYVDAFLRLTVTPQITVENTIFLNVDVENTTPDFSQQVQGNPTLLTQQALTQVLVTDGGTVVIGGVISTKNSVNISQTPLLGSLPGLGNLFKRRAVSTETQELFFFITPKIIQT